MDEDNLDRTDDADARRRVLAYALWEQAGKPDGRDAEFWERAGQLLSEEDRPGRLPSPGRPSSGEMANT